MELLQLHTQLQEHIKWYIKDQDNIENIHSLRVSTRKLLSNSIDGYVFDSKQYKKLIKKSNEIRDIDVFIDEIIPIIPLDLEELKRLFIVYKSSKVRKFIEFLKKSDFNTVSFRLQTHHNTDCYDFLSAQVDTLTFEDLHKVRKSIKQTKYHLSHIAPKETIKKLSNLQDLFGQIQNYYQLYLYAKRFCIDTDTVESLYAISQEIKQKNLNEIQEIIAHIKVQNLIQI